MKTAKSYKVILLFVAFAISIVCAFAFIGTTKVNADTLPEVSSFVEGAGAENASFTEDGLKTEITSGQELKIKNKLVIDNFSTKFSVSNDVSKVFITFSSDSYDVNGNKTEKEGSVSYVKTIENEIVVDFNKNKLILNDKESSATFTKQGEYELSIEVVNNLIVAKLGSATVTETEKALRIHDIDKAVAKVSYSVETESTATFTLISINQKNGEEDFNQSFKVVEENISYAKPRVSVSDKLFAMQSDKTYKAVSYDGDYIDLDITVFDVFGKTSKSDVKVEAGENVSAFGSGSSKFVQFNDKGTLSFELKKDDVVLENYQVEVVDRKDDTTAPIFVLDDRDVIDSFMNAFESSYYKAQEGHYVALGSDIRLPSFANIVSDDYTSYGNIGINLTLKGPTASANSTKTVLTFSCSVAGDYIVYVAFSDLVGNKMEEEKFYKAEDEGIVYGEYKDMVLSFHIDDDAPLSIEANEQINGVVGESFTAKSFTIIGSTVSTTYELFYNESLIAKEEDDGWKLIDKASSITDKSYVSESGYSYDDIQAIAYDGNLTFIPDKMGTYMIKATMTSYVSTRPAKTASALIVVDTEKEVAEEESWIEKNVLSVVFFSIGALCLIGIVVVLCVKPKEKTVAEK